MNSEAKRQAQIGEVRGFIADARWIFARTMPEHPHWYTLRRETPGAAFEAFVMFVREHGYREQFKGRWYTKYDLDGWSYWTMGAPLEQTTLINRARIEPAGEPQRRTHR